MAPLQWESGSRSRRAERLSLVCVVIGCGSRRLTDHADQESVAGGHLEGKVPGLRLEAGPVAPPDGFETVAGPVEVVRPAAGAAMIHQFGDGVIRGPGRPSDFGHVVPLSLLEQPV